MMDDPFANQTNVVNDGEIFAETAPGAVVAGTEEDEMSVPNTRVATAVVKSTTVPAEKSKPKEHLVPLTGEDEQRLVNPKSWFIKKLQRCYYVIKSCS